MLLVWYVDGENAEQLHSFFRTQARARWSRDPIDASSTSAKVKSTAADFYFRMLRYSDDQKKKTRTTDHEWIPCGSLPWTRLSLLTDAQQW